MSAFDDELMEFLRENFEHLHNQLDFIHREVIEILTIMDRMLSASAASRASRTSE